MNEIPADIVRCIQYYLPNPDYANFRRVCRNVNIESERLYRLYHNKWLSDLIKEGDLIGVKYLIENGLDIHSNSDCALRWASSDGQFEIVKYLVEKGANVNIWIDYPLRWASRNGHFEIVKYLVEKGADVHAMRDSALRSALENGHSKMVEYLTAKNPI